MNIPKEIQDNLITYLEAARVAFSDADVSDGIAEQMDISDAEMIRLRDQLQSFLNQD